MKGAFVVFNFGSAQQCIYCLICGAMKRSFDEADLTPHNVVTLQGILVDKLKEDKLKELQRGIHEYVTEAVSKSWLTSAASELKEEDSRRQYLLLMKALEERGKDVDRRVQQEKVVKELFQDIATSVSKMHNLTDSAPRMLTIDKMDGSKPINTDESVILCGRDHRFCSVVMGVLPGNLHNCAVSRIQFAILNMGERIFIIDISSLCGTKASINNWETVDCTSVPNSRKVLPFTFNKSVWVAVNMDSGADALGTCLCISFEKEAMECL